MKMLRLLADTTFYDPKANWKDVPSRYRTPNQQADMFIDVCKFIWPMLFLLLAFILFGTTKRRGDGFTKFLGVVCIVAFFVFGYFDWFRWM